MKKLLVANRSEIAIRCFRAATELGLQTVAVYSYEDRFSLHRFKADEAYLIGPAAGGEPVRSYLNIPAIIEVAQRHGVDAIHPGYGFLSENADFARACELAGITFVGPDAAELLEPFGDKTAAKRLASEGERADRSRAPSTRSRPGRGQGGREGDRLSRHHQGELRRRRPRHARRQERRRAGGQARRRRSAKRAPPSGAPKSSSSASSRRAKHIEVQILGDTHGNLVHLWERDCSVQRRHQKVVEVAPSINLPLELRRRICDAAVRLCRTVRYRNAGTVEFLVDMEREEFYFIEVNPRIQVEHTVTEVVTGIDLVKSADPDRAGTQAARRRR